ncbi:MAG TPA: chromate efflux transporter [Roseiarcus sp.]|nr:chromate efflux transporter [Roseiarcus sp.]
MASKAPLAGTASEVFVAFLKLGLISFGGPIAHLGYFRAEFVERRRWLSEQAFVDLIALAQFLPGPASSQTGFAIGLMRAGYAGGGAAWLGFTLPSAFLLILFAWGAGSLADTRWGLGLLHGLKLVAVAIVAQAVMGMARSLCPDRARASIAVMAIFVYLALSGSLGQIVAILFGGAAGLVVRRGAVDGRAIAMPVPVSRAAALAFLALFFGLLGLTFVPAGRTPIGLFDAFYRSGALVFGGGHVVLPLLHGAVVDKGWISDSAFLAGYGAAQAVPGPLFTFAAYLGAAASVPPGDVANALIALIAIFLPGVLILMGTLPFWQSLSGRPQARAAMEGVNASVVGLLAVVLYNPVWTSAVITPLDFAIVAAAFALLVAWRAPPLAAVLLCAAAGLAMR